MSAKNVIDTQLDSPMLEKLRQDVAAGNVSVIETFWETIAQAGTPLFEAIEDDETHVNATFLWRGDEGTTNVVLFTMLLGRFENYSDNMMTNLPGTDVWYLTKRIRRDLRTVYRFSPNDPLASFSSITSNAEFTELLSKWRSDPFNATTYIFPADEEDPDDYSFVTSVLSGPDARPQTYSDERPDVPKGEVKLTRFTSQIMGNERRVWLYTPPDYSPDAEPYPLLLVFDGWAYVHLIPTPTILDNLIAERLIPPMVAVMVTNEGDTRMQELKFNTEFARFLAEELIPWLHDELNISTNPAQAVIAGSSLGGLAACWIAFTYPTLFGNVLSQSGSYFGGNGDDPEPGWLIRQYLNAEKLPVTFYMDAGMLEIIDFSGQGTTLLGANRHMRDVLKAKGYDVAYAEFSGAHDYIWWQQTLSDGLTALMGNS